MRHELRQRCPPLSFGRLVVQHRHGVSLRVELTWHGVELDTRVRLGPLRLLRLLRAIERLPELGAGMPCGSAGLSVFAG